MLWNYYTAICDTCTDFLDAKQKSSQFSSSLCPCCHEPSPGNAYYLCQDCRDLMEDLGYVDSGWGAWHLDRDSGQIFCIHLDFNWHIVIYCIQYTLLKIMNGC